MGKVKIIGIGLTGLVGSRVVEILKDDYEVENISRQTGIDILKKKDVLNKFKELDDASVVLHLAAKTNVDECEKDKELDIKILEYKDIEKREDEWKKKQTAWAINVFGTQNIADACLKTGKKLFYISTDFVFDGKFLNGYGEEDIPNPLNWYAKTKYEGEKIVQSLLSSWVICRLAYPYRAKFKKADFFQIILNKLQTGKSFKAVIDHIFTPTFIDDIAVAIESLINKNVLGVYHVVGSQSLTPYDAVLNIAQVFNFDTSLIKKSSREEYFRDRAKRPFCLKLKNDKIKKLGVEMRTFKEGIKEIKRQQRFLFL